jgi:protein-S-isoprenylcysteine O-methyltransferase Ste14
MSSPINITRVQHYRRIILAIVLALVGFALLFVATPKDDIYHSYFEAFGIGMIAIGILGRMWCTLYIGGRKSQTIVDKGPYSISRNPLYVFSSIGAAGVGAQTGSVIVALLTGLGCVIAFYLVIKYEEQHLSALFGESYETYKSRVPRLLPKFSLFSDSLILDVNTTRLYSTFKDGLVFFVALPLFEIIETLQKAEVLPVLLHIF